MSKLVIVIEENPIECDRISTVLTRECYNVFTARNAKDGIALFATHLVKVQIVILSTTLLDMSATVVMDTLKAMYPLPHIILLSDDISPKDVIDLMKAGASDLLKRPYHEAELSIAMHQAFDHQSTLENLNRELERTSLMEIKTRLEAFKHHLTHRKREHLAVKPSELALFFPFNTSPHDFTETEVLKAIEDNKIHTLLKEWTKPKVLVVDDEPHVLTGVEMALTDEFEVLMANSAKEAFEMLKTQKPPIDLVLLDIGMPEKSGDQCVEEIKKFDPYIVVVMLTAFDDFDLIIQTIRAGASDYITKPFLNRKLLEKVSYLIQYKLIRQQVTQWMGAELTRF